MSGQQTRRGRISELRVVHSQSFVAAQNNAIRLQSRFCTLFRLIMPRDDEEDAGDISRLMRELVQQLFKTKIGFNFAAKSRSTTHV